MQTVAAAMTDKRDLVALTINALSGGSTPEGFASVFVTLLRELAKGVSVSVRTLAEASGQSSDQVNAVLQQAPEVEYDPAGNIVGYGLPLRQPPHAFGRGPGLDWLKSSLATTAMATDAASSSFKQITCTQTQ